MFRGGAVWPIPYLSIHAIRTEHLSEGPGSACATNGTAAGGWQAREYRNCKISQCWRLSQGANHTTCPYNPARYHFRRGDPACAYEREVALQSTARGT